MGKRAVLFHGQGRNGSHMLGLEAFKDESQVKAWWEFQSSANSQLNAVALDMADEQWLQDQIDKQHERLLADSCAEVAVNASSYGSLVSRYWLKADMATKIVGIIRHPLSWLRSAVAKFPYGESGWMSKASCQNAKQLACGDHCGGAWIGGLYPRDTTTVFGEFRGLTDAQRRLFWWHTVAMRLLEDSRAEPARMTLTMYEGFLFDGDEWRRVMDFVGLPDVPLPSQRTNAVTHGADIGIDEHEIERLCVPVYEKVAHYIHSMK